MCGKPSIIVENGKLHQKEMQKNRFTVDELMEELRMQGITDLTTVKYAILETNGQISVLTRAEERPVTARQMELHPKDGGLPVVIINDAGCSPAICTAAGWTTPGWTGSSGPTTCAAAPTCSC